MKKLGDLVILIKAIPQGFSSTRGHIQLPGCAFANVFTFGYLSCKQTSHRFGTATEYTATVGHNTKTRYI